MQIYGPFRVSTPQSAQNVERIAASNQSVESTSADSLGPVDQLDLSESSAANGVENQQEIAGEGIRFERVAELRRQIADGTYDTPERLDAALDRFLDLRG
ncbi:MAG: flagellar biosynthesis anti-sigma factor FlgM [Planctomycetota bacterium]